MNPDHVTLVVPCYNVADTLGRALSAVETLDPAPARVLCVDDGSTDGTGELIRTWEGVDLVTHSENRGLGATLNTALSRTDTRGLAKIDADILVGHDWLGKLCRVCAEQDVALVQGRFEEQVTTLADEWRAKHPSPTFPSEPRDDDPINGSNILCRTAALRDVGGWDEQYERAFDDITLCLRLIDAGYHIHYSPDVVATHVRTDTWREVLHTAWAYHYDSLSGRDNPERVTDLLRRVPGLCYRSGECIATDLVERDLHLLPISVVRLAYHLKWDLESVHEAGG